MTAHSGSPARNTKASVWTVVLIPSGLLIAAGLAYGLLANKPQPVEARMATSATEIQGAPLDAAPQGAPIDAPAPAASASPSPTSPQAVEPAPQPEVAAASAASTSSADSSASAAPSAPSNPTLQKIAPSADDGKMVGDFMQVSFALLASYNYVYPNLDGKMEEGAGSQPKADAKPPQLPDQIPAKIKALNGKKVTLQGFMVPSEVERGKIKSFVLLQNTMGCCFGVMPMMNEWVYVSMEPGKASEFYPDLPISVFGTIEVGEEIEQGTVISLYRMKAEKVTPPNSASGDVR